MSRDIRVGVKNPDSMLDAPYVDVISIAKTNENFRLLYDSKGRFTLHHISAEEAKVSDGSEFFSTDLFANWIYSLGFNGRLIRVFYFVMSLVNVAFVLLFLSAVQIV